MAEAFAKIKAIFLTIPENRSEGVYAATVARTPGSNAIRPPPPPPSAGEGSAPAKVAGAREKRARGAPEQFERGIPREKICGSPEGEKARSRPHFTFRPALPSLITLHYETVRHLRLPRHHPRGIRLKFKKGCPTSIILIKRNMFSQRLHNYCRNFFLLRRPLRPLFHLPR